MTARPTQDEIDEAFAEIESKLAINCARKAVGVRSPSLPLSASATKTIFALYPNLKPKVPKVP
jgi:hypothetical protein